MEYRVENMNTIHLVGKAEKQLVDRVQADKFWDNCREDGTLAELTEYSTSAEKGWIGIADGSSFDGKSYMYYISTPYNKSVLPGGYTAIELPASEWMKFSCSSLGIENTADKDIWQIIYSDILPASGYEPTGYQLEVYPYGDGSYPDELSEIWISVNKRL